jgi:RNA polymerase sigma-70 factor (ECF subfamily)
VRSERERVYDAYLASAARVGDRNALGKLAERWHPKLLRHAWRLTGDTELASDITQEAWMDILKGIGGLRDTWAFAAWAFQIVTRSAARSIKSGERRQAVNAAFAREPEFAPGEADRNEARSDLATVRALMARLPAEQRAALGLFYLEGLRVAEIAVALGIAPGTVKTRLMYARAKLRDQLKGKHDEQD